MHISRIGLMAILGLAMNSPVFAQFTPTISLSAPQFHASGQGNITTVGAIQRLTNKLVVKDIRTWDKYHGIRVRRAGSSTVLHSADTGWQPSQGSSATVFHDTMQKHEGNASVECRMPAGGTATSLEGIPVCEVRLATKLEISADEVRLWIMTSVQTQRGDFQLTFIKKELDIKTNQMVEKPTYKLTLPALQAGRWSEVFLELKRRDGYLRQGDEEIILLQCLARCDQARSLRLDDIGTVQDHITTVVKVQPLQHISELEAIQLENEPQTAMGNGLPFHRGHLGVIELDSPALRSVFGEAVYHDDSRAVAQWLESSNTHGGALLLAPPGTYNISLNPLPAFGNTRALPLYNKTHLKCQDPEHTIFKNTGRSKTGPTIMFRSAHPEAERITIENCGFDWNGWNSRDFADTIVISPHDTPTGPPGTTKTIVVRGNRFIDSALPGLQGCDENQDRCVTRQRVDIFVSRVDRTWIEHNRHSSGGRIKAGGPGTRIWIRHNTLDFVNDNAITVVDLTPGGVTNHVDISDNTITNPVTAGIFFGADGEEAAELPGMTVTNVTIARNRISGFFITAGIWGMLPQMAREIYIGQNVVEAVRGSSGTAAVGIGVKRQLNNAATELEITENVVTAQEPFARYDLAAILFAGPISNSMIRDNRIQGSDTQPQATNVDRGIYFTRGPYVDVKVESNQVSRSLTALEIGEFAGPVSGLHIDRNEFTDSVHPDIGQVTVRLSPQPTVQVSITHNEIHDGQGYGIFCTTQLSYANNVFSNNQKGDKSPQCP